MTMRLSTIVWMIVLVLGAFGVYMVKYKVRTIKAEAVATHKQIMEEKRNLHVLNAEWAFLTRPDRIRQLAQKYLDIKPMRGQQIAEFTSLPYAKTEIARQDASSPYAIKLVSAGAANGEELGDE